jgi:hypothetical protein
MREGKIVHRESGTFNDPAVAQKWIDKRERELDKPGGLKAAKIGKETLGDATDAISPPASRRWAIPRRRFYEH